MESYALKIEVKEFELAEIMNDLTEAQEKIYECYERLGKLGVLSLVSGTGEITNNRILEKPSNQDCVRMRTIEQCADYFKQKDPDTKLTKYRIKMMAKNKEVSTVTSGNKTLINLDDLIKHLSENDAGSEVEYRVKSTSKIRRI